MLLISGRARGIDALCRLYRKCSLYNNGYHRAIMSDDESYDEGGEYEEDHSTYGRRRPVFGFDDFERFFYYIFLKILTYNKIY